MERDNKIILGAVLILLVGMLSFNFSSLTGKASQSGTTSATLTVSPARVDLAPRNSYRAGQELVLVTVTVNSGEIENNIKLCRAGGSCSIGEGFTACTKSACKKGTYTKTVGVDYDMASTTGETFQYFWRAEERKSSGGAPVEKFDSNTLTVTQEAEPYRGIGGD